MPFVKVHVSQGLELSNQNLILKQIRNALIQILGIKDSHGHLILYESPSMAREVHESRDINFVFIEIQMFSGRTDEQKEKLFKKITSIIKAHIAVNENDILINIIETERKNWGGRGGIPVSKLDLGY